MTTIQKSLDGAVLTLTLNQPELRNAFNDDVIVELTQAFQDANQRPDVRVVVLAASGKAFCAGADLNWMRRMADYTQDENLQDAAALANMLQVIYQCSKPTIAKIQGDVYAGGMGLVAACDIAVCVDTARFCLSEVKLGLIPATISPYVLRAMGARNAHRYFLTAEVFDAREAHRINFVHEVVGVDQLNDKVDHIAQAFLVTGPRATSACKTLVQQVANRDINDALIAHTVAEIADIRSSAEGREGVGSFLQKRSPAWVASVAPTAAA